MIISLLESLRIQRRGRDISCRIEQSRDSDSAQDKYQVFPRIGQVLHESLVGETFNKGLFVSLHEDVGVLCSKMGFDKVTNSTFHHGRYPLCLFFRSGSWV
ncbi:hypothetical protein Mapa_002609 [Marchantia paleacea]|nr:hypothetical protein Mapa_002609 [Marchantia paleacea]